jgi:hypothetical protein
VGDKNLKKRKRMKIFSQHTVTQMGDQDLRGVYDEQICQHSRVSPERYPLGLGGRQKSEEAERMKIFSQPTVTQMGDQDLRGAVKSSFFQHGFVSLCRTQ